MPRTPFTCPFCQKTFGVPQAMLGKDATCPACKAPVTLPGHATDAVTAKKPKEVATFELVEEKRPWLSTFLDRFVPPSPATDVAGSRTASGLILFGIAALALAGIAGAVLRNAGIESGRRAREESMRHLDAAHQTNLDTTDRIVELDKAIAADSGNTQAYALRGRCRYLLGLQYLGHGNEVVGNRQIRLAMEDFQRILRDDPSVQREIDEIQDAARRDAILNGRR